jgi:hypothetical protein
VSTCKLQRYQTSIYKRSLGIPSNTSNLIALFEMGRHPMQIDWLVRAVKYWNKRVAAREDNSLLSQLFMDNVHYGLTHEQPVKCWARELCDGLKLINPDEDWEGRMRSWNPFDVRQVAKLASQAFCETIQQFSSDPLADDCMARQRCMYAQCMFSENEQHQTSLKAPAYLTMVAPLPGKRALARIRTGTAPFRANQEHGIPYSQSTCTHEQCTNQSVENEYHMLLQCCRLTEIRAKHADVLHGCLSVADLMKAAYDVNRAGGLMNYALDIIQCTCQRH